MQAADSQPIRHAAGHSVNEAAGDDALLACPNCDLVQRLPGIKPGQSVCCPRCETELWRPREDSLNRTLALACAAAVLWIVANTIPMLGLMAVGNKCFTTIIRGAELLWEHGMHSVAALVFFTAVLAPALQIIFLLLILGGARCETPPAWVGTLLRYLPFTRLWSMLEVMLLGVLVSLTKIAEYATVLTGHALFAVGGLVVILAAMQSTFDAREVWARVQWVQSRHRAEAGRMVEAAT
jgi:paraquat-inducible protein A